MGDSIIAIIGLIGLLGLIVFGILAFIFLILKSRRTKLMFILSGLSFSLFIIMLIISLIFFPNKDISVHISEEVTLRADEDYEINVTLENWQEAGEIYLAEMWHNSDGEVDSQVIAIEITKENIHEEVAIVTTNVSEIETRKLVTITLEQMEAEKFLQNALDIDRVNPFSDDDFESYLRPPKKSDVYLSILNSDWSTEQVVSEQNEKQEALVEAQKEKTAKEKAQAEAKRKKAKKNKQKKAEEKGTPSSGKLDELKVHFIDVGQADGALIEFADYAILIDSGDWHGNQTVSYLQKQGIKKLDLMVGTHPHADHIGQMDKVLNKFPVGEVWMSGDTATSQVFERIITEIEENDVGYDEPRAGDSYKIGDLTIDILSPIEITGNANDDSIVMKLTYGEVRFLFTGDAETPAEKRMVSSGEDIGAQVLKVGHHGSDTSTTQDFLDKVNPEVAVISAAARSKYNHPDKSVVDRINKNGIKLYATKTHGNIVISTDGLSYDIVTDKKGKVTPGDANE